MKIQTNRLDMAQIKDSDWELFQSLNRNPRVISLCFDEPSPEDIKQSFESRLPTWNRNSEQWLCLTITLRETGEKVGVTGFRLVDGVAEVGYLFLPQYHGLGFGTESLNALIIWAIEELGIQSFSAIVTEGNIGSEKVLLRSSFSLKEIVPDAYKIGDRLYADHIYTKNNIAT
ncbi:acetyltransferase [Vibrio coralliilyticus]|uniref:GNAT family N-acetyltransferase n=1 Tax=Vibrio coralliilyticus TaxID=190893 RepID=UPI0008109C5F|nr:GNAT family N-acetyltransferase [Vibrio coralliilyticus]ANW23146.1 acetyltransferase [Vibrio coralliilyticus]